VSSSCVWQNRKWSTQTSTDYFSYAAVGERGIDEHVCLFVDCHLRKLYTFSTSANVVVHDTSVTHGRGHWPGSPLASCRHIMAKNRRGEKAYTENDSTTGSTCDTAACTQNDPPAPDWERSLISTIALLTREPMISHHHHRHHRMISHAVSKGRRVVSPRWQRRAALHSPSSPVPHRSPSVLQGVSRDWPVYVMPGRHPETCFLWGALLAIGCCGLAYNDSSFELWTHQRSYSTGAPVPGSGIDSCSGE